MPVGILELLNAFQDAKDQSLPWKYISMFVSQVDFRLNDFPDDRINNSLL